MACHLVSSYKHIVDRIHFFCMFKIVSTILTHKKLALDKLCTTQNYFVIPSYYLAHPWCLVNKLIKLMDAYFKIASVGI